eukprot:PRCOL_00000065-RA
MDARLTSGAPSSSGGGGGGSWPEVAPGEHMVHLNVYDLPLEGVPSWITPCTYHCGFGIFHSGVEVHGVEYCFGGHDEDSSGVFKLRPRSGYQGAVLRKRHMLGGTRATSAEVEQLCQALGDTKYRGRNYHLLHRNCNHFTTDLVNELTGKDVAPLYVNRLASMAITCSPCLPEELVGTVEPALFDDVAPRSGGSVNETDRLLNAPVSTSGMYR